MNVYVEGTTRGLLKVRDIQKNGETLLRIPTNFTNERIDLLGYNEEKNILFASCRDGSFCLWKLDHEWRNKNVDIEE